MQTILNLHGFELQYTNLVIFWLFSFFYIYKLKISKKYILTISLLVVYFIFKSIFLEFGNYYLKAIIILTTIPLYYIIFSNTDFNTIEKYCEKYLLVFLLLGTIVTISWIFVGEYRNTSTFSVLIVAILCGKKLLCKVLFTPFFLAAKTQYQFWIITVFILKVMRITHTRYCRIVVFLVCITVPYLLYINFDQLTFLAYSHSSSLSERLEETKFIYSSISNFGYEFWIGSNIGTSIYLEANDSYRGYTHSFYLWLILYFGVPVSLIFFLFYLWKKRVDKGFHSYVIILLLFSNCFTFLIFTNPFVTSLLLTKKN